MSESCDELSGNVEDETLARPGGRASWDTLAKVERNSVSSTKGKHRAHRRFVLNLETPAAKMGKTGLSWAS